MNKLPSKCPCGSGQLYEHCCGPIISGKLNALTPEALMCSRYTAYSLANIDYIIASMKPPAATGFNAKEAKKWAENSKWLGLKVIATSLSEDKNTGYVEFMATYFFQGKLNVLHEKSTFKYIEGRWYYITGSS